MGKPKKNRQNKRELKKQDTTKIRDSAELNVNSRRELTSVCGSDNEETRCDSLGEVSKVRDESGRDGNAEGCHVGNQGKLALLPKDERKMFERCPEEKAKKISELTKEAQAEAQDCNSGPASTPKEEVEECDSKFVETEQVDAREDNEYSSEEKFKGQGCKKKTKKEEKDFLKINTVYGDLFTAPKDHSLAHCVAADLRMGSGIAVNFRQEFKEIQILLDQKKKVGQVAILEDNGRYIYYLITKKLSNGKPRYEDLRRSLQEMKIHCVKHNVTNLSMPRIGCGLDRLDWGDVERILKEEFADTSMNITIYDFNQDLNFTPASRTQDKSSLWVVEKCMNLVDIEHGTVLVYLGTVQGDVNRTVAELDKKFNFVWDYKRKSKELGEILEIQKNGEYLYGLIVKEKEENPLSYTTLYKCLTKLKQIIRKYKCIYYIGFEAFIDGDDDLTVEKLITLLKYVFYIDKIEAWICWPTELWQKYKEETIVKGRYGQDELSVKGKSGSESETRKSGENVYPKRNFTDDSRNRQFLYGGRQGREEPPPRRSIEGKSGSESETWRSRKNF